MEAEIASSSRRARFVLTVLGLLALAGLGWWYVQQGDEWAVPLPVASSASAAEHAEQSSLGALDAVAAATDTTRSTVVGAQVQATTVAVANTDSQGFVLEGFLRPAPGRTALTEPQGVVLTDEGGSARSTTCGTDGHFAFDGLAPGRYWLHAKSRADGHASATIDLVEDMRHDLALVLATVVYVRVDGLDPDQTLILGVRAIATSEPPGRSAARNGTTQSGAQAVGHYESSITGLSGVPDQYLGVLVLDGDPPVYASLVCNDLVLETRRVLPAQDEVAFDFEANDQRVARGALRFRVIDGVTDLPIDRAAASLKGSAWSMSLAVPGGAGEAKSVPPGNHVLELRAKGYVAAQLALFIEPGVTTDLGDIRLSSGVSITGWLVGTERARGPVALRYDPCNAEGVRRDLGSGITVVSPKLDGSFRIDALAPDRYRIESMTDLTLGLAESVRIVDARLGSVGGVRLELVLGVPLVVTASERWKPGWCFRVHDDVGTQILSHTLNGPRPTSVLLAPGSYSVELLRGPDETTRVPIVVAGAPVRIDMP